MSAFRRGELSDADAGRRSGAGRAPFGEHERATAQRDFGYGIETFEFEESGENACRR